MVWSASVHYYRATATKIMRSSGSVVSPATFAAVVESHCRLDITLIICLTVQLIWRKIVPLRKRMYNTYAYVFR